jgi:hypothetical protein
MPHKIVRAPKQKRTAALLSVTDLVKVFDRHKQLILSPQLVRFTRLGSASLSDSENISKPEAGKFPAALSQFY